MPKEHKKRGRREEEKKRKRDVDDDTTSKRHKNEDVDEHIPDAEAFQQEATDGVTPAALPFYGMLDDDEQEYFKRADEMLELNQFDDAEARTLFLESVYKEADGKELKIANSQSCSRLLERLILLSTPDQLKGLFQKFSGHFLNLVQHRFASHCCEALFLQAAPVVTQELAKPDLQTPPSSDPDQVFVSMENLFLYTLNELEGYVGFLMTDRFASHVLRVLLVIFSGSPLEKQTKSVMQSKRKEKVGVAGSEKGQDLVLEKRTVPQSFLRALEKVINDSVSGFEPHYLRSLSTHPLGNPTLQLLLKLELSHFGKSRAKDEKSIIHRLLPDDPIAEGTESASFINGLVYDPIGSRLLETIIENAPGKLFKSIYGEFFKERMGSLARNEIAGYVAGKILERLGKDDLEEAMRQIVDQIPNLVERNRTSIIKTLIERCMAREVDTSPIKAQLETAYGGSNGFEVTRILKLSGEDAKPNGKQEHSPEKVHGSLLAQTMMLVEGPLGSLVFDSLANLSPELSIQIARDPTASRTLQAALTSKNASVIFRRKMIQQFYGKVGELALDPAASRVIDAIWDGTHGLAFIRERIAEELAENENSLRESFVGRAVWRNWKMDLYKRNRYDWVKQSRYTAGNDGFQSFPESNTATSPQNQHNHRSGRQMTAIELARQKHAASKAAGAKRKEALAKKDGKRDGRGEL
ncbi:ARM repeat-containing protein [Cucurbitaria berberidis CBS 394.84]|uniref:Nucleolar protein 9 n=1 Tax=Cucurbitaria berberidis CBS 394.84 TaxID=1168544 RepID=A0A9P4GE87_9PLEO|nr:ARM repeat-containing protein [Cucurbitaria berberidis CBS 394.84]KAF1843639.1 ARM repeat-containing protein [Cucurbitaria berberidis CBS 394.84]